MRNKKTVLTRDEQTLKDLIAARNRIRVGGWLTGWLGRYESPLAPVCALGGIYAVTGHVRWSRMNRRTRAVVKEVERAMEVKTRFGIASRNDYALSQWQVMDCFGSAAAVVRQRVHESFVRLDRTEFRPAPTLTQPAPEPQQPEQELVGATT